MKHFFRKCENLLFLVLAAVIILFALSPAAEATSTKYDSSFLSDNMLNADPGEDPHLKIDPGLPEYYLIDYQSQSSAVQSSGTRQEMLRGHDSKSLSVNRHSRVNPKLRILLQVFLRTLRH